MSIGLISGASNMRVLEDWQAMIAHNLANSSTPGFQKSTFEVMGKQYHKISQTEDSKEARTTIPTGVAVRSMGMGEIKTTDNPYDLAIHGKGFFSLQGEGGITLYTRDGEFHRNEEGILVNKMGYPLLAEGTTIEILPTEGPITITSDGVISQDGQSVAKISIYDFEHPELIQRGSGSYFLDPDNEAGIRPVEFPTIRQHQIEMSTVTPLTEMVSMIQVSRAYEITQKLIQEDDERAEKAIQTFSV